MSLRPIDLQILFGRLNEVSQQQAAAQEAKEHAQKVSGSEIVEQSLRNGDRVSKTDEVPEGPDQDHKVKVEEQSQHEPRQRKHPGHKYSPNQDEEEKKTIEVFKDPDLGNRVDIST